MPGLIPLILIIVPIIEIFLFVQIGGAIGLGGTFFVILLTAMLGARAIRRQGLNALARAQSQMAAGEAPVGEIVHGVLILLAGVFLLTPGFLTDFLGLFLLWPAGRVIILEFAMGLILPSLFARFSNGRNAPARKADPNVIDGDYRVEDPDD